MAHINIEKDVPGIRSLVNFRPETGKPLYALVQTLLRGINALTEAERELIAAYVSNRNECTFCTSSHAAAARYVYGEDNYLVDEVLQNMEQSGINDKMKALLNIAGKVQLNGKEVLQGDVIAAKIAGADDRQIHDTVLIAATFCMFNRYVDGLASLTPTSDATYREMGKHMVDNGYHFTKPIVKITDGQRRMKKSSILKKATA